MRHHYQRASALRQEESDRLSWLAFIDSAGLGTVAKCAGVMSSKGGKLVVVNPSGKVKQMFQLRRIDQIIALFPTLDSAFQSFSGPREAPKE